MSYAIDVYRGDAKAIRNFIDYSCYVSMFPQLVAGPIVRFSEIADQLLHRTHTATKFARGIAFFSLGLAKKVLLANPCGKIADLAFDAGSLSPLDAWYGVTAYTFQIYFDFSALLGHGHRSRPDVRVRVREELRFARTWRSRSPISGAAGTSRCRPGCVTTCTCRSAATARARVAPT